MNAMSSAAHIRTLLLDELDTHAGAWLTVKQLLELIDPPPATHPWPLRERRESSRKRQQQHRRYLYHLRMLASEGVLESGQDPATGLFRFRRKGKEIIDGAAVVSTDHALDKLIEKPIAFSFDWFADVPHALEALRAMRDIAKSPLHIHGVERVLRDDHTGQWFRIIRSMGDEKVPVIITLVLRGMMEAYSVERVLLHAKPSLRFIVIIPSDRLMTYHGLMVATGSMPGSSFIFLQMGAPSQDRVVVSPAQALQPNVVQKSTGTAIPGQTQIALAVKGAVAPLKSRRGRILRIDDNQP